MATGAALRYRACFQALRLRDLPGKLTTMLLPLQALLEESAPLVLVEIRRARGSAPREVGASMLVSETATGGTIGGGRLEQIGIARARAMLAAGEAADILSVPLGPEIGQCCGGFVELALERVDDALRARLSADLTREAAGRPHVYVFGAGHVGLALARCLALLPVRPVLVDSRPEALAGAPGCVDRRLLALPESALADAPPGSAVVILTHDHALDFLIAAEALAARRFAYVGMIGSLTKRALFGRSLPEELSDSDLVCPIGDASVRDKRPEVIAALVAAELAGRLFGRSKQPRVEVADAAKSAGHVG